MSQRRYHVQLSVRERQQLERYVKQGKPAARAVTRARILLLADEHYSDEEIREVLERFSFEWDQVPAVSKPPANICRANCE